MSQLAANLTSRLADSDSAILAKIHETGYWRVRIRPSEFRKSLVPTLDECRKIVRSSAVRLRGWDYPHWREEEVINGQDWIQGAVDWCCYVQYWRFFQSGQFVHHFAMREDYKGRSSERLDRSEGRFLDISSSLFTITEIFEFSARLSTRGISAPSFDISIELIGTEGRLLEYRWEPQKFTGSHKCQIPAIQFEATYVAAELLGNAAGVALNATKWIFERFNWTTIPEKILAEDQRKFLERRL